jgi:3',5'-cyclic AMP phosphodiesterase CpdA
MFSIYFINNCYRLSLRETEIAMSTGKLIAGIIMAILVASIMGFVIIQNSRLTNDVIFKFVVASDGHYGEPGTEYEKNYATLVNWCKNITDLDLVVVTGDISNSGTEAELEGAKAYLDTLDVPYYVVKGNHDDNETAFLSVFGYSSLNYTFDDSGYHFAVINSSQDSTFLDANELAWLDSDLTRNSAETCFVFGHISQINSGETYDIDNDNFEMMIASHSNVKALFFGHIHSSYAVNSANGTKICYNGHFGGSYGTYCGYRIVEIYEDGTIKTYYTNSTNIFSTAYLK